MKGMASRDAAALHSAPSRYRASRNTGFVEAQFRHVSP